MIKEKVGRDKPRVSIKIPIPKCLQAAKQKFSESKQGTLFKFG